MIFNNFFDLAQQYEKKKNNFQCNLAPIKGDRYIKLFKIKDCALFIDI